LGVATIAFGGVGFIFKSILRSVVPKFQIPPRLYFFVKWAYHLCVFVFVSAGWMMTLVNFLVRIVFGKSSPVSYACSVVTGQVSSRVCAMISFYACAAMVGMIIFGRGGVFRKCFGTCVLLVRAAYSWRMTWIKFLVNAYFGQAGSIGYACASAAGQGKLFLAVLFAQYVLKNVK
jgi:hypothetical protein